MLIIYCIGLFDGCFGFGVWQCWNCRVPFFLLGWRGTPEEVASVRGVDAVGGVFEVLWVDVVEGRQRKEASLRAGTPSGDTTRAP
jgi:hypothetical protein